MRLIDADKLLEVLNKKSVPFNANVNDAILTAPTVDAVERELYEQCKFDKDIAEEQLKELVRCKDCKYSSPNGKYGCSLITDDGSREMGLLADDYCSYGERNNENE